MVEPMQISMDSPDGAYRILGYDNGVVRINDGAYNVSLVVAPQTLVTEWGPRAVDELTNHHMGRIRELDPEVVLLGTGAVQQFPGRELMRDFLQAGVGMEVMDTASACRTYNLLMSEGRRVAAALIIDAAASG
jgi:uncharacterized protein